MPLTTIKSSNIEDAEVKNVDISPTAAIDSSKVSGLDTSQLETNAFNIGILGFKMAVNEIVKGLGEIVKEVKEAKSVNEKIKILQANDSRELRGIFELAYDNRLKWALPEGNPPYKPLDKSFDNQGMLLQEMRRMYIFLEGKANMPQARREQSFVQLLEQLDPDDAALVIQAKDRKILGCSKSTVKKAFHADFFLDDPANQDTK